MMNYRKFCIDNRKHHLDICTAWHMHNYFSVYPCSPSSENASMSRENVATVRFLAGILAHTKRLHIHKHVIAM